MRIWGLAIDDVWAQGTTLFNLRSQAQRQLNLPTLPVILYIVDFDRTPNDPQGDVVMLIMMRVLHKT
jgi:hypothetical protein